jgi:hypothetical protein
MAKLRLLLATALLGTLLMVPATANAARPAATDLFTDIPVSGTIASIGGTFTGTLDVTRFTVQNGALAAQGLLTGTLKDALGTTIGTVTNAAVTIPVTDIAATACEILHLELGPIDLNLLGLMVHLDQVVLDITAQPGPGNLLGNLLCAIAGLLDSNAPLNFIANLLNQLLGLLG